MPAGRPTKYKEAMVKQVGIYVDARLGTRKLVTLAGLAVELGIHRETILEWEKIHPEFSDVIKRLREVQRDQLQCEGVQGKFNPTMCIFLLKNHHAFVDRHEHTGAGGEGIGLQIMRLETDYEKLGKQASGQMVEDEPPVQDQGQRGESDNVPAEPDPAPTPGGEGQSPAEPDPQS